MSNGPGNSKAGEKEELQEQRFPAACGEMVEDQTFPRTHGGDFFCLWQPLVSNLLVFILAYGIFPAVFSLCAVDEEERESCWVGIWPRAAHHRGESKNSQYACSTVEDDQESEVTQSTWYKIPSAMM